jgi:hypothetical protein
LTYPELVIYYNQ